MSKLAPSLNYSFLGEKSYLIDQGSFTPVTVSLLPRHDVCVDQENTYPRAPLYKSKVGLTNRKEESNDFSLSFSTYRVGSSGPVSYDPGVSSQRQVIVYHKVTDSIDCEVSRVRYSDGFYFSTL